MGNGIDLARAADVGRREDEGQVVHIREADGEPAYYSEGNEKKPVVIRIAGTYSSVYRKTLDAQTQRMVKRRQPSLSVEQLAANRVDLVASCILGWDGFTNNEVAFPFSRENAVLLLTRAPWIREQLEEAQADHQGFSRSSYAS